MSRTLLIDSRAILDIQHAMVWFEQQRPGLSQQFRRRLEETVERVQRYPESYPCFRGKLRRALLHQFDYAVVYHLPADLIEIVAVLSCRRHPVRFIQRRMRHTD